MPVIDPVATSKDHLPAEPVWSIGEANAGCNVLLVAVNPSAATSAASVALAGEHNCPWKPISTRIGHSRIKNRGIIERFMTGCFYVIPESQVKHEGSADLEVVLHVTGIIIRYPSWLPSSNPQTPTINTTKQEAGKSISRGANQSRGG